MERRHLGKRLTSFEPTNDEVVDESHDPGSSNGVVGANVSNNVALGGKRHVGAYEFAPQRCERSSNEPEADWMEDKFIAPISVLLPPSKFIVYLGRTVSTRCEDGLNAFTYRKRHTLLKSVTSPGSQSRDVANDL